MGHKMMESKMKQEETAMKLRKLFHNDLKVHLPKDAHRKFTAHCQDGSKEEFK